MIIEGIITGFCVSFLLKVYPEIIPLKVKNETDTWTSAWMLMACLIFPLQALAHRFVVFAWAEKGKVHVETTFSSRRPVQKGKIQVVTADGKTLLTGTTDEKGTFVFDIPDPLKGDLTIRLAAGTGHAGMWTIKQEEMAREPEPEALESKMAQKAAVEAGPSMVRIIGGIALIFALALGVSFIHRRQKIKG